MSRSARNKYTSSEQLTSHYRPKEAARIHRAHRHDVGPSMHFGNLTTDRALIQYQTGPRAGQQLAVYRKMLARVVRDAGESGTSIPYRLSFSSYLPPSR